MHVVGERYRLIKGDCIEILKEMPSRYFDLVFTDPPYDKNDVGLETLTEKQKIQIAKQLVRITKKTGNIAIMCGKECKWKWYNIMSKFAELHSEVIWCYRNPPQFRYPLRYTRAFAWAHDTILCFRLSKNNYFNRDATITNLRNRVDWIIHNVEVGLLRKIKERLKETTPKPEGVADKINLFLCPVGGKVIDPFMGTGTLILSAYKLRNARVTGIEKNEDAFKIAVNRFKKFNNLKQKSLENF